MSSSIIKLLQKYTPLSDIKLEIPPSPDLGDYAFPCFELAKKLHKSPSQISLDLSKKIPLSKDLEKITAVGPYLNFYLNKSFRNKKVLSLILKQKSKYGSKNLGKKNLFLIEHTSINPNASPHLGRARNAILGDCISRLLRFQNYKVQVHYFVNDIGKQIALLVLGTKPKTQFKDLLKIYISMNKRLEKDLKLESQVFDLLRKFEQGDKPTIKRFQNTVSICLKGQISILKELGITYNFFDYESKYLFTKSTQAILKRLEKTGRLFLDEENRWVLDQSGFGLPMKAPYLVLTRADKTSLYPLRDLAYTSDKMKKSPNNLIILGEDQKLYFQQLKLALSLLNEPSPQALHYSFVLLSEGKKMSTRKGNLILLEDFIKEALKKAHSKINSPKLAKSIAYGAIKYSILKVSQDKNVVFNWNQALSFEGDSAPYLQYAHTRAASILKKARKFQPSFNFTETLESKLISKLGLFPDIIEKALFSPHILANYSYELSQLFNEFYHKYPVLNSPLELRNSRLTLVKAIKQVLNTSLMLLGIDSLEKM